MALSRIWSRFFSPRTVRQDWIGHIPDEKLRAFEAATQQWNSAYSMGSVALNEAIELWRTGQLLYARQQASFSSDLLFRLAAELSRACEIMQDEARHFTDIPAVDPLHPHNFRCASAQRAAGWNTLFHQVLFSRRSRFFQKLRVLASTIDELAAEFEAKADTIASGAASRSAEAWATLEEVHDDLNTCLRESEVVLKSFLRSLPVEMTPVVRLRLEAPLEAMPRRTRSRRMSGVSA